MYAVIFFSVYYQIYLTNYLDEKQFFETSKLHIMRAAFPHDQDLIGLFDIFTHEESTDNKVVVILKATKCNTMQIVVSPRGMCFSARAE